MPRAYSANLKTVWRAKVAADALGITGWHLLGGPDMFYKDEHGKTIRRPLKEVEAEAKSKG